MQATASNMQANANKCNTNKHNPRNEDGRLEKKTELGWARQRFLSVLHRYSASQWPLANQHAMQAWMGRMRLGCAPSKGTWKQGCCRSTWSSYICEGGNATTSTRHISARMRPGWPGTPRIFFKLFFFKKKFAS